MTLATTRARRSPARDIMERSGKARGYTLTVLKVPNVLKALIVLIARSFGSGAASTCERREITASLAHCFDTLVHRGIHQVSFYIVPH